MAATGVLPQTGYLNILQRPRIHAVVQFTAPRKSSQGLATLALLVQIVRVFLASILLGTTLTMDSNKASLHPASDVSQLPRQENTVEPPLQAGQRPARAEVEDSGVVIIDRFPFGFPGAPITDPLDRLDSATENRSSPIGGRPRGDSIWAPFRSQCDWEFARWAKLRGSTSSAVTDLLAIPEVCTVLYSLYHVPSALMCCKRWSTSSGCCITTQENLITLLTTTWLGHPHFSVGNSKSDMSTCSFFVAMPYSVSDHCMVTLNLRNTWSSHRSSITPTSHEHAVL